MQAPLYDVKNKLSEYVKIAESGEPVEICKRGEPTVVIVRKQDFVKPNETPPNRFEQVHNAWLKRTGGFTKEEYVEIQKMWDELEAERKVIAPERPNPWLD